MKNKLTAAILAFFLGGFGIHRFYLNQSGLGILYLLFCWSFIPAFIAFIDFIIFLTMSEDSFNLKYNRAYLPVQQAAPTVVIHNTNSSGNIPAPPPLKEEPLSTATPLPAISEAKTTKMDPFEKAGNDKYDDYDFDGAINDYLKSLNVKPKNTEVHFKLGALYSLLERPENALFHLDKAVENGFYDFERIKTHDHLAFLRTQPAFDAFVNNGYRLVKSIEASDELDLSDAIISQVEKLAKMKDNGLITEEEYQTQKTRLLRF